MLARDSAEELRGGAVGCQRSVGERGLERGAGCEELRKRDDLGAGARGLARQAFALVEVATDVADDKDGGYAHGAGRSVSGGEPESSADTGGPAARSGAAFMS